VKYRVLIHITSKKKACNVLTQHCCLFPPKPLVVGFNVDTPGLGLIVVLRICMNNFILYCFIT